MIVKQIITDNQDKLLQILLYQEYRKNYGIRNTIMSIKSDTCTAENYKLISFDEWLEQILVNF